MNIKPDITEQAQALFLQHLPEGWSYDEDSRDISVFAFNRHVNRHERVGPWDFVDFSLRHKMLDLGGKLTIETVAKENNEYVVWVAYCRDGKVGGFGLSDSTQCCQPESDAIIKAWCHLQALLKEHEAVKP